MCSAMFQIWIELRRIKQNARQLFVFSAFITEESEKCAGTGLNFQDITDNRNTVNKKCIKMVQYLNHSA